jgi:hypothetical protein
MLPQSNSGLIWDPIPALLYGNEKNHENPVSRIDTLHAKTWILKILNTDHLEEFQN